MDQRRLALSEEEEVLDTELGYLRHFLQAAPMLREEARCLLPPPDELTPPMPDAPNRAEIRRVQRLSYLEGFKLIGLLSVFLLCAVWLVERFTTLVP